PIVHAGETARWVAQEPAAQRVTLAGLRWGWGEVPQHKLPSLRLATAFWRWLLVVPGSKCRRFASLAEPRLTPSRRAACSSSPSARAYASASLMRIAGSLQSALCARCASIVLGSASG